MLGACPGPRAIWIVLRGSKWVYITGLYSIITYSNSIVTYNLFISWNIPQVYMGPSDLQHLVTGMRMCRRLVCKFRCLDHRIGWTFTGGNPLMVKSMVSFRCSLKPFKPLHLFQRSLQAKRCPEELLLKDLLGWSYTDDHSHPSG